MNYLNKASFAEKFKVSYQVQSFIKLIEMNPVTDKPKLKCKGLLTIAFALKLFYTDLKH